MILLLKNDLICQKFKFMNKNQYNSVAVKLKYLLAVVESVIAVKFLTYSISRVFFLSLSFEIINLRSTESLVLLYD